MVSARVSVRVSHPYFIDHPLLVQKLLVNVC